MAPLSTPRLAAATGSKLPAESGGKPPHSKSVLQLSPMDDPTPRHLKERTEKHRCIKCLTEIPRDEYLRNDFLCDKCAEVETPEKDAR